MLIASNIPLLIIATLLFAITAPIVGCFLCGLDRKISAKMQGRVGPKLLQPLYDVLKLFNKEDASINTSERRYVVMALVFALIAGGLFFSGSNLLLCIFMISLSSLLIVVASYSSRSVYSELGAGREILQILSYEPAVLLFAIVYSVALMKSSFNISDAMNVSTVFLLDAPIIIKALPIFLCLLFVLTIKLRKSPFDLSQAQHAHQELVGGFSTEMCGRTLGYLEILHWIESVLFLAWIGLFFVYSANFSILIAIVISLIIWLFEVLIDNVNARVKWQAMLASSWVITFVFGCINLCLLMYL